MADKKILVIDDDPDLVEGIKIALEANGFQVATAENGTEGLEKIKSAPPDLIVMDVMMDTITEGFQISQKLKNPDPKSEYKPYAQIPILMLTGISKKMNMEFSPEKDEDFLPVEAFIEKPVKLNALIEKIKQMLQKG
ncbi:MAG TPA: response regulator [Desulfosalsimonadaceae bacterium]|nr:response regulator [Desulfosalsimonadaceae bacterium]